MSSNQNQLPLFKPLKIIKTRPIIFNEFAHYLDPEYKSYRPFVIFYDDQEDCYYYLKARDARQANGKLKKDSKYTNPSSSSFTGEVFIKGTGVANSLLEKDSYVDCSQIFKINASLLESIVDKNSIEYITTKVLEDDDIDLIISGIDTCLFKVPPFLSLIEVKLKLSNMGMKANSLYLHPDKQRLAEYLYLNTGDYSIKKGCVPDDFKLTDQKLDTVYSFRKEFIKSYYSNYSKVIYELNGTEYTILSYDEFEHKIKNLSDKEISSLDIAKHTNALLYNDCSELLEKLKEGIKAKDRGGDGGMSM